MLVFNDLGINYWISILTIFNFFRGYFNFFSCILTFLGCCAPSRSETGAFCMSSACYLHVVCTHPPPPVIVRTWCKPHASCTHSWTMYMQAACMCMSSATCIQLACVYPCALLAHVFAVCTRCLLMGAGSFWNGAGACGCTHSHLKVKKLIVHLYTLKLKTNGFTVAEYI